MRPYRRIRQPRAVRAHTVRPSGSTGSSSGSRPVTTTKKPRCDDPYKACEFNDPEDFYDYYYYDFEDYEEAYDYYYDHQHD